MSSEIAPDANPPLPLNASEFRQKRLPYRNLTCAIDEGKNKLQDTLNEMDKIQRSASHGGYAYSDLAGDLITRTRE